MPGSEAVTVNPLAILRRDLAPSFSAAEPAAAASEPTVPKEAAPLRVIGRGTFGTVYSSPGSYYATKKTLHDRSKLRKDFILGRKMWSCVNFSAAPVLRGEPTFSGLVVPRVPEYIESYPYGEGPDLARNEAWWKDNAARFPQGNGDEKPGAAFAMERIRPVEERVRRALVELFFPESAKAAAMQDSDNEDCLIRPYLGLDWSEVGDDVKTERTSLRNFPLYPDEMKRLHMDPLVVAQDMALGLAAAHWEARIDMCDAEFVIAPWSAHASEGSRSAHPYRELAGLGRMPETSEVEKGRNRKYRLWILDFDKANECGVATRTWREDIRRLVNGTRANDPYYPRMIPASGGGYEISRAFSRVYIEASQVLLRKRMWDWWGDVPDEERQLVLSWPREVLREWQRQEREAMSEERYNELKRAGVEGWAAEADRECT